MVSILELLAFLLVAMFFLGFGWYMSQASKLWSTPEYGGTTYIAACVKAMAFGVFLYAGILAADYFNVPEARRDTGVLICAPLVAVGWILSSRHYKRRKVAEGRAHAELR
jgi:uncharacterized BrkB/YihY/UPF0761 family membrane protein